MYVCFFSFPQKEMPIDISGHHYHHNHHYNDFVKKIFNLFFTCYSYDGIWLFFSSESYCHFFNFLRPSMNHVYFFLYSWDLYESIEAKAIKILFFFFFLLMLTNCPLKIFIHKHRDRAAKKKTKSLATNKETSSQTQTHTEDLFASFLFSLFFTFY